MRVVQPVLITLFLLQSFPIFSQKKPLDHTVYDGWQNIGERGISNKGEWVFFAVNPQEGDGVLYIKDSSGKSIIALPRGYNAAFAPGENFLLCKIRAPFAATREAKIKKKKPEEMPKDSLAIVNLASREIKKIAAVKQYALPETTTNSWLVYWLEKQTATKEIKATPDSLTTLNELLRSADSLTRVSDSLRKKATELTSRGMSALQPPAIKKSMASPSPTNAATDTEEGSDLILYNLANGKEYKYAQVTEWIFSKFGHTLVYEQSKKADNSKGKNTVHLVQTASATDQTILAGFYDAKAYVLDEAGQQLAFVAERDSGNKAAQRFYQVWYFKAGGDSAQLLAHQKSPGLPAGYTIAESNGNRADMGFRRAGSEQLFFSQSGQRLFVGLSSIIPPKDTSLPDFERVNLDIWHYNDDQIQPAQLRSLNADINRSYLARYDFTNQQIVPLGNKALRTVWSTREGDGKHFYASSDTGKRIAAQWQGFTLSDLYQLQPDNGTTTLIKKDVKANLVTTSPGGDYLVWYDEQQKTYFSYHAPQKKMTAFAKDIPYPLYDEENDVPDDANAEGLVKWTEDERFIFLYDRV
jgi:hypothetical protein